MTCELLGRVGAHGGLHVVGAPHRNQTQKFAHTFVVGFEWVKPLVHSLVYTYIKVLLDAAQITHHRFTFPGGAWVFYGGPKWQKAMYQVEMFPAVVLRVAVVYPPTMAKDAGTTQSSANFSASGSYDPMTGRSASTFQDGEGAHGTHARPVSPRQQVGRPFAARDKARSMPQR
jgi:hypothetical protein